METTTQTPTAYSYIRFSSAPQEFGDSLNRQVEQSKVYALSHGLLLNETLKLQDKGISAFHGVHKTKGNLGIFLDLVERGEIKKGSYLLIENLDRLSREKIMTSLTTFVDLINAGINLVTIADDTVYNLDNINENQEKLFRSLNEMVRATKESERKSFMLKKAWLSKRNNVSEIKLTGKVPAWITPIYKQISPTKKIVTGFDIIPERAKVVNEIFDLKLSGLGTYSIAQALNKSALWIPAKSGWRKSYIKKILTDNRAVIGEFQLHKISNGKRTPEGEPIEGYFPAIVATEKFNRVQALIFETKSLAGVSGGRNGQLSNLFGHLAVCGICGAPMAYLNKGNSTSWQYLQCDRFRRKVNGGCTNGKLKKYSLIENNILTYCKELNVSDIIPGNDQLMKEISFLTAKVQNIDGENIDLEKRISNLIDTVELSVDKNIRERLVKSASEYEKRVEALSIEKNEIQEKISKLQSAAGNSEKQLFDIKQVIEKMKTVSGEERIKIRMNLRNQLRQLISSIEIFNTTFLINFKSGVKRAIETSLQSKEVILQEWEE